MGISGSFIPVPGGRVWHRVIGDGQGTPLLVIHGIPGSNSGYPEGLAALGDDRPVILYDQLGGGRSDRPADPSCWSLERFVEEVGAVREALDLRRVHLLGHSWGGLLALEHATRAPGVESLVLSSAPLSIPEYVQDMERLRFSLPSAVLQTLEQHEAAGTTMSPEYQGGVMSFRQRHVFHGTDWPEDFLGLLGAINPEVFVAIWGPEPFDCTGAIRNYDGFVRLGEVQCPVLFAVGRHDATTPEAAARYRDATPRGRLAVFEQSAHMAMLEEPGQYVTVVREFLRDIDEQRA